MSSTLYPSDTQKLVLIKLKVLNPMSIANNVPTQRCRINEPRESENIAAES